MKGFTHEEGRNFRNSIFDFRYFFHDSGDHNADRYNTIFIEKPLVSAVTWEMYSKLSQDSSQRDLKVEP